MLDHHTTNNCFFILQFLEQESNIKEAQERVNTENEPVFKPRNEVCMQLLMQCINSIQLSKLKNMESVCMLVACNLGCDLN